MAYTEQADFEEKAKVLADFLKRLGQHGLNRSFSNTTALELGGSGGVFGGLLSNSVGRVIVSDIIDTQVQYQGEFPKLLKEKFLRNGYDFSLGKIEFHVADAMKLPYRNDYFDLVVSVNAFEHIPDPVAALREALRVTKTGGIVYLTFDPVWTADSGSHFSHLVQEPWAHLICDTEEFCTRMIRAGADGFSTEEFRTAMNRMPARVYRDDFPKELTTLGANAFHVDKWTGCVHDDFVKHPNRFAAATRLGCPPEDLLIRGFCFLVCK